MVDSTESHARYSTTKKEYSSNWLDIINASEQKATEPIETYLVSTVNQVLEEDGQVRRYTFGRKDPKKKNRTILMVGETGTGKSTLINTMLNYMLGVKWEDNIRFEIIPDEDKIDETESKTIEMTVYEIFGLEEVPFSLTVIDTPGFKDPEKDKSTAHNLYKLLSSFNVVHELHAVCLVVKASLNRQTPSHKYIFDAILSLLGENMKNNIMTLITFSDWSPSSKAVELLTKSGVPNLEDNTFLFNNCPLQEFDKECEEMYKTSWDNGAESFEKFSKALDNMAAWPQSLKMTVDILEHHQNVEACIPRLESQIMNVEQKHKELERQNKTVKELMEKVVDLVSPKKTISTEKIFCNVCQRLCPFPWFWNWIKQLSPDYTCSSCPGGKCRVMHHNKNIKIIVLENEENITHMKNEAETIISTAEKIGQALENAVAKKTKLIEKCFQSISQLQKHALKLDSTHVDSLMKILEKNNETEKVAELQEILKKNKETEKVEELQEMMENKETEKMAELQKMLENKETEKMAELQKMMENKETERVEELQKMLENKETEKMAELQKMMENKETEKMAELQKMMENNETEKMAELQKMMENNETEKMAELQKMMENKDTEKMAELQKMMENNETEKMAELQKMMENKDTEKMAELQKMMENKETEKMAELQKMMENKETEKMAELQKMMENRETEKIAELQKMMENKETEKMAELQKMMENKETERVEELQKMLENKETEKMAELQKMLENKETEKMAELQKMLENKETEKMAELQKMLENKETEKMAELQKMMETKETEKMAEPQKMLENKETEKVAELQEMMEKNKETEKMAELQEMMEKSV